ncbi:hypothetical protein JTE90_005485 [Oedothorax gibbosus]|uniref:Uncharacterized protein n=1 Tax=Oedothorax gibbosus TaxID=931172 RepID=A0AAV6UNL3_9ARAC|nr:hypothetical protein JTE90_005485 [Oedothorax gibbosus]
MFISDTLSRDCESDKTEIPEMNIEVHLVVPLTHEKSVELREAVRNDEELSKLVETITVGWPTKIDDVHESLKKYWSFRDEFGYYDGVIFRGSRVLIPPPLRAATMRAIHLGHLGIQ